MKNGKIKTVLQSILKLLYYIVIAFVCLIAGILVYYIISVQVHSNDENYVPGISIYTIVSPSMTPNINVYDVVVNVRVKQPSDIKVGDIITFKSQAATSEGMTITHRVIAIDQLPDGTYEYMTQGDNNPEPDSAYVTFDNVIGVEIITIPGLGKIQFLIANKKSWLFLLLIPITIYLIKEIYKLIDLLGLKKKVSKVLEKEEEPTIDKDKQAALKDQLKKDLFGKYKKELETNEPLSVVPIIEASENNIEKIGITAPDQPQELSVVSQTSEKPKEINILEITGEIELPRVKTHEVLDTSDLTFTENYFLEESRIKVINVEETKNKKPGSITKNIENDDGAKTIHLGKDPFIPNKNPHMRVEKPEGEDIKELRRKELNIPNRKENELEAPQTPNKTLDDKKQLNLNPTNIKKIKRSTQQNPQEDNKELKTKPRLIGFEKVKK